MKIWIKLLIGTIIGVFLGFLLPLARPDQQETLSFLATLVIHIGRYAIFGLIFVSLVIGTYELKQDKKLIKVYLRIILYMIISTFILVLLGVLSAAFIPIERVPIIIEEGVAGTSPGIKEMILNVIPKNMFKAFITEGDFLFPLYFLAFLIGLNFSFDRLVTRPAISFFDSMSRIFYHINSFIVEILALGMVILSIQFIKEVRTTEELELFRQLLIILIIDSGVIIFGIFPALLYFLGKRENPYKWLYAMIAPAITALFSRDIYFTLSSLVKHSKDSMGIPRKVGSASLPLFAMFGRAGTAMVTAVSFIVIITSYSSLGISLQLFLWVMVFSFLFSFTLSTAPAAGVFVALAGMCALYGKGIEEGYLILGAVMPVLISIGTVLDVFTSAFVSLLISQHEEVHKEIEAADFI